MEETKQFMTKMQSRIRETTGNSKPPRYPEKCRTTNSLLILHIGGPLEIN